MMDRRRAAHTGRSRPCCNADRSRLRHRVPLCRSPVAGRSAARHVRAAPPRKLRRSAPHAPGDVTGQRGHGGGRRLSKAFLPAGVTAVAWCSPLPTAEEDVDVAGIDHVQAPPSCSRPALPGHRAATSTLRRALPARLHRLCCLRVVGSSAEPPCTRPDERVSGAWSGSPVTVLSTRPTGACRPRSGNATGADMVGMSWGAMTAFPLIVMPPWR